MMILTKKNGKLGIENVKTLFSILLSIYAQIKNLIKDFNFADLISLGMEIVKYKDDLDIFKIAWEEIKDLKVEDGEFQDLSSHLNSEALKLGLSTENVLILVQEALFLVSEIFELWDHVLEVYGKGTKFYDRFRSIYIKEKIAA